MPPYFGSLPQGPGHRARPLARPPKGRRGKEGVLETLLHPAEGLGTFPHILPTCTEGHQPLGPAREPVHPVDLQRLSRPGGRGPGVIRATRKGRGADRLRNSEEDGTRSRASLQAASRASGESPGGPQDPHCPPPRFLRGLCPSAWLRESPQASPPLAALPSTYPHNAQIRRCPQNPRCREGLQGPPTGFSSPRTPHRSPDTLPSRPQEMAFFQDRDHLESGGSEVKCWWLSHVRLCDPMDCSPPGSSVHGILQARILEWVAMPFSRGSSRLKDQIWSPALQAASLLSEPSGKPHMNCCRGKQALGGLEPPTFWLMAECANRLCHRDI